MLIINADDWGGWQSATDAAKLVASAGRITAASAMVFMDDSARAAELSQGTNLQIGLHVNFTQPFDDPRCASELRSHQQRIGRFLRSSKFSLLIFNPLLCRSFRLVHAAQYEEFLRLYGRLPTHIDGHQHMHLCSNMLLQRVIPSGHRVRRSFSFSPGEKNWLNRAYRRWVDQRLAQSYQLTDRFFALSQSMKSEKFHRILELSKQSDVELMTHPEKPAEQAFLMSDDFLAAVRPAPSACPTPQ